MTPLNPFPELLTYALAAPLIIRLALGGFYALWASRKLQDLWGEGVKNAGTWPWWAARGTALAAFFGSVSVLAGWYTQIGALALLFSSLYLACEKKTRVQFVLLAAMALSLLVSGAGFFALDMPL